MKRIPLILSPALLLLLPAIALYPMLHASAEKDGVDSSTAIQEAAPSEAAPSEAAPLDSAVAAPAAPAAGRPWFWRWSPPRRLSPRRLSHRRWHGRLWRRRPFGRLSSIAPLWRFPSIRRLPHRRRFQPWRRCRPSPLSSFTVPRLRAGAFLEKEATSLCLNLLLSLVPAPASGPSSRVSFLPAVIT